MYICPESVSVLIGLCNIFIFVTLTVKQCVAEAKHITEDKFTDNKCQQQ